MIREYKITTNNGAIVNGVIQCNIHAWLNDSDVFSGSLARYPDLEELDKFGAKLEAFLNLLEVERCNLINENNRMRVKTNFYLDLMIPYLMEKDDVETFITDIGELRNDHQSANNLIQFIRLLKATKK